MKYVAFWNREKIKIVESKSKTSVEMPFEFKTFPNIPVSNFMDEDFIYILSSKIKKMNPWFKRVFTFSNEVISLIYDDFTKDENHMLLVKLVSSSFRKAYIVEKSRLLNHLYKDESSKDYLCIYSSERNYVIAKVINTIPVELKILSNHLSNEVLIELENLKKANPHLKINSDIKEFSDVFISEDEIINNLIFMGSRIETSPNLSKET